MHQINPLSWQRFQNIQDFVSFWQDERDCKHRVDEHSIASPCFLAIIAKQFAWNSDYFRTVDAVPASSHAAHQKRCQSG